MTSPGEKLTIVLEDVAGTSWWASLLTTLGSQYGSSQQRFVGKVDGKTRYKSSAFPAARPASPTSPHEDWAPGLAAALEELQRDLSKDGWVQVSRGSDPWSLVYERAGSDV